MVRLAASIPLPDEDEDLGDGIEDVGPLVDSAGAGDATASTSTGVAGATFSLPNVTWTWPSESWVAQKVEEMAGTDTLTRIFPQAQRVTTLNKERMQCNARARINPQTRLWEAFDCSATCKRKSDFLRHLRTCYLGGKRPEERANGRRTLALASASTSAPALAPQQEAQLSISEPHINRRKRSRQNEEDEDAAWEDEDEGPNRKGKKARRY